MSRPSNVRARVLGVLETHLHARDVRETTHLFRDLKLDSVQQLTLVVELENEFSICFEPGEESGVETVGDVVTLVERHFGTTS